ncbi:hypothetical protein EVAR_92987_1 [Eumeta japonica]|uniref:Uncharacterized protein n=1 Tax=Eumeta variegata TaxID=151549 RepID=A0A4C1TDX6_EUMVA|nr:hypothetical protein EVAR_92987_1 [Eumeta japonica]
MSQDKGKIMNIEHQSIFINLLNLDGLPFSAIIDKNVAKAKLLILENRRIKQLEIARDAGISKERANEIIDEYLGMSEARRELRHTMWPPAPPPAPPPPVYRIRHGSWSYCVEKIQ